MKIEISDLASLLNKQPDELTSALKDGDNWKDDAGKTVISLVTEHLNAALAEKKRQYDESKVNLEKKGFKEGSQMMAKKLKELMPNLASFEGDELLTKANEELEKLRKGSSSLTEDQIKSSQTYIDGLRAQNNLHEQNLQKIKDEYEGKISEFSKKDVFRVVDSKIDAYFDTLELMEGVTPELKQDWKETLKLKVKSGYQFNIDASGNPVILNQKGEPLQDETGKLVAIDDVLKKSSSHVVTKVNTSREGFGMKKKEDGKVDLTSIPPAKSKKEFLEVSKKLKEQGVSVQDLSKWQSQVNVASLPQE